MSAGRALGMWRGLCVVLGLTLVAEAGDWTSWRGPLGTGSSDAAINAVKFGAESYRWRTPLPGKGCSTPIVLGERIYLTAPVDGQDAVLSLAADGQEIWRTKFGAEDAGKHRNGSGCNASPITDGDAIYVYFKSGTFAAVETDGKVLWQTDIVAKYGKTNLYWDHGTSPVLTTRHVILARMHEGESWVAAFDKTTGEVAWKVPRNFQTPVEGDHGYATPLVLTHGGRESILVWGAEHLTLHDAETGAVTWSCGNFNPEAQKLWPSIATPVLIDDLLTIAHGRNDRGLPRLFGVHLSGAGDVTATNHVWRRDDVGTFVPSPAVHHGHVVLVRDRGEVAAIDPKTGATVWEGAFPKHRSNYYASPLVAGDMLYAPREDGVVCVAKIAGDRFEFLAENDMGESIIASPAPLGTGLLLRGERHLFCVSGAAK
jgi:outer membrane protein assembly factor BamB